MPAVQFRVNLHLMPPSEIYFPPARPHPIAGRVLALISSRFYPLRLLPPALGHQPCHRLLQSRFCDLITHNPPPTTHNPQHRAIIPNVNKSRRVRLSFGRHNDLEVKPVLSQRQARAGAIGIAFHAFVVPGIINCRCPPSVARSRPSKPATRVPPIINPPSARPLRCVNSREASRLPYLLTW